MRNRKDSIINHIDKESYTDRGARDKAGASAVDDISEEEIKNFSSPEETDNTVEGKINSLPSGAGTAGSGAGALITESSVSEAGSGNAVPEVSGDEAGSPGSVFSSVGTGAASHDVSSGTVACTLLSGDANDGSNVTVPEEITEKKPVRIKSDKVAVEFRNVTKTYNLYKNDRQRFRAIFSSHIDCKVRNAISGFNMTIREGESVALLGRNGAGKSTLLKMITGVAYPTSGEIIVNGRVSALLELTAGFDPEFTGIENIFFRGELLGMKRDEIEKIVPAVVEFADIGDYMDQPVRTYSSGMKARLGFAINVNTDPDILIVDEALAVGDISFRRKCTESVRELVDEKNVTFLLVTHSPDAALEYCERGIVLKTGKMLFDGPIDEATDYYHEMLKKEDEIMKKKKADNLRIQMEKAEKEAAERRLKKEQVRGGAV